ncbi:MAG: hypothetical protein IPP33_06965 [Flavobacteriales bacterium]|nr:hypothetical protein [Flavobacteriales bacterium]
MPMQRPTIALALASLLLTVSPGVRSQWTSDPAVNTPISVGADDQSDPRIISDGEGGAIIAWSDNRPESNGRGVFAQRINADGEPIWAPNGVPVVTQPAGQKILEDIVSDGNGGAIVVYLLYDNGGYHDIFAQRFDATGQPLWNAAGAPVCINIYPQLEPVAVSDGNGGVIVAWWDARNDGADVFAQHLDANGQDQWGTNGIPVATGDNNQVGVRIATNDANGALITWFGGYFGVNPGGVRMQNVAGDGSMLWPLNGVRVCQLVSDQSVPELCADGSGGGIATWVDRRNDGSGDLYAQHIDATGALQWSTDGVLIDDGLGEQGQVAMARSGANSTFIAWSTPPDTVNVDNNIKAQLVNDAGNALWDPLGKLICGQPLYQSFPKVVEDVNGDAVIAWLDSRNATDNNLFMQRVTTAGASSWPLDGAPITSGGMSDHWWNSPYSLLNNQLLTMANGTVAVWNKVPVGGFFGDVYASLMGPDGTLVATSIGEQGRSRPYGIVSDGHSLVIRSSTGAVMGLMCMDGLGRLIQQPMSAASTEVRIPTIGLSPGLIVARFQLDGTWHTERIVLGAF